VSRWGSFIGLAAIVVVFAFLFYTVMAQFLLPIFIALVLVVICQPLHRRILAQVGGRESLAAATTTTIVLLVFLAPVALLSSKAIVEAVSLADKLSQPETLYELQEMRNRVGLDLPPKDAETARLRIKAKLDEIDDAVLAVQGGDGSEKSREDLHRILDYTYRQLGKMVQELEKGRQADIAHRIWKPDQAWTKQRLEAIKQLGDLAAHVRSLEEKIHVPSPTSEMVLDEPRTPIVGEPATPGDVKEMDHLKARVDELEAELAIMRARLLDVPKKEPAAETPRAQDNPGDQEEDEPQEKSDDQAAEDAETDPLATAPADAKAEPDAAEAKKAAAPDEAAIPSKSETNGEIKAAGDTQSHLSPELVGELTKLPRDFAAIEQVLLGPQWLYGAKHLANPDESLVASAIKNVQAWLFPVAGSAAGLAGALALGLFVMTVALYYFLADGKAMIGAILQFSPLDDAHEDALLAQFEQISRAVVVATVATAVVQGLLGGVGYWAAGLKNYFLLTMVTMVASMIPFIGASLVWGAAAVYLALTGHPYEAIGLSVYGFVIVSTVDNFVKPAILHGQSNLHPLLALLSVLGGVTALGPIGLFVGPMAVAFLQALLKIMHSELASLNRDMAHGHSQASAAGAVAGAAASAAVESALHENAKSAVVVAKVTTQPNPPAGSKKQPKRRR